jgi:predicted aspartyl protease
VGRFAVEIELANNDDLALMRAGERMPDEVRRVRLRGVVDSGVTRLVIPESVADKLGLRRSGRVGVRNADGRLAQRDLAGEVHLTYGGRSSVFNAVVGPQRDSALIGAIVLEDLDLVIDCARQTLAPRDPKQIISEIE